MKRTIAGLMLVCCGVFESFAADADGPMQIFVVADQKRQCWAVLQPGKIDLKTAFPDAQFIYKGPTEFEGLLYQSCEITVPKEKFLAKFEFCALSSAISSSCTVSYHAAGGRNIAFSAISDGGKTPGEAYCGFVCLKK